jgi:Uma2 family endonuclease
MLPDLRPVLENGMRVSRAEFERRYSAMPKLKKAELIEGVVFMGSPVRNHHHATPHGALVTLAGLYAFATRRVNMADNATVRLDAENEPQPDVLLRVIPKAGGRCLDTDDGYLEGPPELCIEVAGSSASIDVGKKKRAFQRNGVQEYLVWLTEDAACEWRELVEGVYQALPKQDGVVRSRVFPGFWVDTEALLVGDFARAVAVLQEGIASTEHSDFVALLAERGAD